MRGNREIRGPLLQGIAEALHAAFVAVATPTPGYVPSEIAVTVTREVFAQAVREASRCDRIMHDYDAGTEEIMINGECDHRRLVVMCETTSRGDIW